MKRLGVWVFLSLAATGLLLGPIAIGEAGSGAPSSPSSARDFTISSSPVNLALTPGDSGKFLITLTSVNGFRDRLALSVTSSPTGPSLTLSTTSLTLKPNRVATSELTVSSTTSTPRGNYIVTATAAGKKVSHSVDQSVSVSAKQVIPVGDFSLNFGTPTLLTIFAGTSSSTLIAVSSLDGFSGNVTFDSNPQQGITTSFDPTAVGITANGTVSSNLNISVSPAIPLGTYSFNVIGTSGSLSHSVTVAVTVAGAPTTGPDFTISASPDALLLSGPPVRSTIELTSVGNFSGSVFLSLLVLAPPQIDLSTSISPATLTLSPGQTVTSTLEVFSSFPVQNFTAPSGNFTIIVIGMSGSLSHSVSVNVSFPVQNLPDFSIDVQPSTLVVTQGYSNGAKVVVTSIGGFTGTVFLQAAVFGDRTAPPTAFLEQSSVFLGTNGTASTFLDVNTSGITPVGGYNVTVTGSSGPLSHVFIGAIIVIPLEGADFAMVADPTFLVLAGQPGFSTITLQSLSEFSGTVGLSIVVLGTTQIFLNTTLSPGSVALFPGSTATSTLEVFAFPAFNSTLFPSNSTIIVTGTSGSLSHSVAVEILVLGQNLPPVAQFSFFPSNPFVGDFVQFDGSRSFDPDGFIVSWTWDFGDCNGGFCFSGFGSFVSHTYFSPGTYTVVLTVTDNAGATATTALNILVQARPLHDVSIVSVYPQPVVAVESQTVVVTVVLVNNGQSSENVQVSVFFDSSLAGTVNATVNNPFSTYVTIFWDTNGVTPGNYTISATISLATDENPQNNSLTDGQVTILPPPTLTVDPSTGSLGTRVLVHGSGFPSPQYGPSYTQVIVTFDDMFMGFTLVEHGEFDFTFSVPHAEPGLHLVKAFDSFSGVSSSVSFTVQAEPAARQMGATVQAGALYFPGDQADIFVLVTVEGSPAANATLDVSVVRPDGSSIVLNASMVQDGLFKASYAIPASNSEGTYAVIATAQFSGLEASAIGSFEVKQAWVVQQAPAIVSALSLTGLLGGIAIAWRKGAFRRKEDSRLF